MLEYVCLGKLLLFRFFPNFDWKPWQQQPSLQTTEQYSWQIKQVQIATLVSWWFVAPVWTLLPQHIMNSDIMIMIPTLSLSSGLELCPSPYSRAYCCHTSLSLQWRALTRPRSSFSLERRVSACCPWKSTRFSTTARTRIFRICKMIQCQRQICFRRLMTIHKVETS